MSTSVRTKQVELPSGAVVTLRPLRAEELNLIAKMGQSNGKRAGTERYEGLVRALQNCTVAVDNSGPFDAFTWSKATDADQMVGIYALRTITFGAFERPLVCDGCDHRWTAPLLLVSESEGGNLRTFPSSDDARVALGGNGLLPPLKLPSGATVVCRLVAGAARKDALKILADLSDDPIIAGLRVRIVKMTREDGTEVEPGDLTQAVREMDAADIPALQEYLADADGGVDDVFGIECPECGCEVEGSTAPFLGDAAFWGFRGRTRKRR